VEFDGRPEHMVILHKPWKVIEKLRGHQLIGNTYSGCHCEGVGTIVEWRRWCLKVGRRENRASAK